ncbi:DUF6950 family protein [Glaciecola sp. 1036]|uniref:DUF6950 family protein n=1 Tax=Alteromonadaceae TaxID=72275 RepID=UPI003D074092
MMPIRKKDWFKRLINYVQTHIQTPFKYGEFDCCLFACDAVIEMTGKDPAIRYRGKYSTKRGALKALKSIGGGSIESAFTKMFGDMDVPLSAMRGDVVLVETEQGPAAAVYLGANNVAAASEAGVIYLPFSSIQGVWHIDNLEVSLCLQ